MEEGNSSPSLKNSGFSCQKLMKFSEDELNDIYGYVAERLIKEGIGNSSLKNTLDLIKEVEKKLEKVPQASPQVDDSKPKPRLFNPPRKRTELEDAGGHIPESVLQPISNKEIRSHLMDWEDGMHIGGKR